MKKCCGSCVSWSTFGDAQGLCYVSKGIKSVDKEPCENYSTCKKENLSFAFLSRYGNPKIITLIDNDYCIYFFCGFDNVNHSFNITDDINDERIIEYYDEKSYRKDFQAVWQMCKTSSIWYPNGEFKAKFEPVDCDEKVRIRELETANAELKESRDYYQRLWDSTLSERMKGI